MVQKIEIALTDEVADLFDAALVDEENFNKFARFLLLQGLSAHYQSLGEDEAAKKVESLIKQIGNF